MKRLVILTLATLLVHFTVAQSSYPTVPHPEFFKTIPPIDGNTPDWAVMMYGEDPNMFEVTTAFIKYYEVNEYVKTVHGQNYKFWLRTAGEYVNEEGFIRLPTQAQEEAFYKKIKKRKGEAAAKSSANWTSIGPFETYHSGSLEPTSNQANVYSLDQSESHPDILFAGTESGAIFKSTDRGLNWSPTSYEETFVGSFGGIEIHPTNPDWVLVAVNKRIYRTTDGGGTWMEVKYTNASGYEIKYRPSNPDSVFCVASNGLYLSIDAGLTWSNALFSETCYDLDWHTAHPDSVFLLKKNDALLRAELFVSGDGGVTWTLKDNGYYTPADPANAGVSGGKIAVTAADPSRIYVCLIGAEKVDDNGWIGVLRSDDGGENWTVPVGQYGGPYQSINTDPWNVAAYGSGYHQGFYNFDLEASPTDPDLIWIGTIRLSESADGGATFTAIGAANSQRLGNVHADIQDIEVNGDEVWVANDGGIEYSNDKLQSSVSRKRGIAGSNFWGFGTGWNKDVFTGGLYHNGNATYYQEFGFGNSMKLGGVEEATGYINPMNNLRAYHGYSSKVDVRSIPDAIGESYQNLSDLTKRPNEHYFTSYSSGLFFDPYYADHVYMGEGSSVWKSTDGGYQWQQLVDFGAGGRTLELAVSRKNPDYIYAVFIPDDGGYWDWKEMYRTTDEGETWNKLTDIPTSSRAKLEMTLNPDDENEIWVGAYHGNNGNKVYQSLDGGTTWINKTTAALDGENVLDVFYQGGTDDLVYALTNNGIFYYNNTTSDWVGFSDGLPMRPRSFRIEPFFRDSKLRLATNGQGIWETPLAGASLPVAQPITQTDSIFCSRDTVEFDCYSIIDHDGASWEWAFSPAPLHVSSLTDRNPQVVFGQDGSYDVTLKVTDGNGNMSSKTIEDMVKVESRCEADTLPLQALHTVDNGDYFISENANLTNLTHFTVTGWWKPNGTQQPYAALFSSGDWCAHCDYTEGLIYNYHGGRLWYKWPGNADNWAGHSGMYVPENEWSYVALVIEPTQATMYLNDQKYVHTKALDPGEIQNIHIGYGHYSKSFKGDIDEVTMWKRALTEAEIRRMRHLTKEDKIGNDPDLIGYWQFNELVGGGKLMDKAGAYHGTLNSGAVLEKSTAPIGGGASQILDLTNAQYEYDLSDVGTKIHLSDCDEPNGQLVVSRLNVVPDTLPNANPAPSNYWLFNYYDGTGSFPPLDSLELESNDPVWLAQLGSANDAVVHLRSENGDSATWEVKAKAVDLTTNVLRFNRNANITRSTQIALTKGAGYFDEMNLDKICDVDTIPGNALDLPGGSGNYAVVPQLDLNTNTFTTSVWIKPNGLQNDNAGIIFCRGGSTTSGIHIKSNNEVRYHWDGGNWGWSSGAIAPADEWTHVALVVESTQATIYLNGVPYVNNSSHAIEAFDNTIRIGNDPHSSSRTFNGLVDEVCIWDRALSQNEIRELMYLTKEDILAADPNLKVYLQFNESAGKIYDKTNYGNHATLNSSNVTRAASTAPVGGGQSSRNDITSGGVYTFGNTGVTMGFNPSATTYPDGEVVVSRINVAPDSLTPTSNSAAGSVYWVVHNYGNNPTFDPLDSLVLEQVPNVYAANAAEQFHAYKRASNAFGDTWGMPIDTADALLTNVNGTGRLTFSNDNNINNFSQFAIGDSRGVVMDAKVFLEGPFAAGVMSDALRSAHHLPQKEPYADLGFTHIGGGNEICSATVFTPSGNDAVVDWLIVELRDNNDPAVVQFTRSALLQSDGSVVEMDGISPLKFDFAPMDHYYIALRHRNHMGAMTASPIALSETPILLDFTNGAMATWGADALKDLGSGVYGLPVADINNDGLIDATDRHLTWNERDQTGYHSSDINMDGQVDLTDRTLVWLNRNMIEQLP